MTFPQSPRFSHVHIPRPMDIFNTRFAAQADVPVDRKNATLAAFSSTGPVWACRFLYPQRADLCRHKLSEHVVPDQRASSTRPNHTLETRAGRIWFILHLARPRAVNCTAMPDARCVCSSHVVPRFSWCHRHAAHPPRQLYIGPASHGGANEEVLRMAELEIGSLANVHQRFIQARRRHAETKLMGLRGTACNKNYEPCAARIHQACVGPMEVSRSLGQ